MNILVSIEKQGHVQDIAIGLPSGAGAESQAVAKEVVEAVMSKMHPEADVLVITPDELDELKDEAEDKLQELEDQRDVLRGEFEWRKFRNPDATQSELYESIEQNREGIEAAEAAVSILDNPESASQIHVVRELIEEAEAKRSEAHDDSIVLDDENDHPLWATD